jgi:propionyl-CoA carboxylase alpha chain
VVEAARKTRADAVHPGYGFLSENSGFARAVEAAKVVFIGPPAAAVEAMGDKIASKKLAAEAGVPTVPGHLGVVADLEEAAEIAKKIGYPVMIKASAGGGGKGMRIAYEEASLAEGFERAASEAVSSFGDGRLLLEKFIEEPRHIEIQVLADAHGNVIHLGERECSIQRRNQKVVEEAPSPFLDAPTRERMGAAAVALARQVGYRSAGTVEFIVDRERNFYFLEMNTRLQVEHPVTELVTGLDLVEEMIRIAAGERLRFRQEDIQRDGWAIEARVYAEDPFRGFLPSVGRLTRYRPPAEGEAGGATVRIDGGVVEGSEISRFYDPMIAKLCVHSHSRAAAIDAMEHALAAFVIDGIRHNIPFLAALMAHPRWREGRLSTSFIAQEFPQSFHGVVPGETQRQMLAAIATAVGLSELRRGRSGKGKPNSLRAPADWVVAFDGTQIPVHVTDIGRRSLGLVVSNDTTVQVETDWRPGDRVWSGLIAREPITAQIERSGPRFRIAFRGISASIQFLTPRAAELARLMPERAEVDSSRQLLCPMPGLVVSIGVAEGDDVTPDQPLAVIEAMKMENVLRAERAATVSRILAKPGDSLAVDSVIMEFEFTQRK